MSKSERVCQFRDVRSFNKNDSKVVHSKDRIFVVSNIKDRTDRVLRAVLSTGTRGCGVDWLCETLTTKAKHPYSSTDIRTSLVKLRKLRLVVLRGAGRSAYWRATPDAWALWRKTKIVKL